MYMLFTTRPLIRLDYYNINNFWNETGSVASKSFLSYCITVTNVNMLILVIEAVLILQILGNLYSIKNRMGNVIENKWTKWIPQLKLWRSAKPAGQVYRFVLHPVPSCTEHIALPVLYIYKGQRATGCVSSQLISALTKICCTNWLKNMSLAVVSRLTRITRSNSLARNWNWVNDLF